MSHLSPYLELSKSQKDSIKSSKRISNPGCYPTGFIALIRPLVDAGIIPADAPLTVNAVSGYSGGGKGLIEIYESDDHEPWGAYGYSMVRYEMYVVLLGIFGVLYLNLALFHTTASVEPQASSRNGKVHRPQDKANLSTSSSHFRPRNGCISSSSLLAPQIRHYR